MRLKHVYQVFLNRYKVCPPNYYGNDITNLCVLKCPTLNFIYNQKCVSKCPVNNYANTTGFCVSALSCPTLNPSTGNIITYYYADDSTGKCVLSN